MQNVVKTSEIGVLENNGWKEVPWPVRLAAAAEYSHTTMGLKNFLICIWILKPWPFQTLPYYRRMIIRWYEDIPTVYTSFNQKSSPIEYYALVALRKEYNVDGLNIIICWQACMLVLRKNLKCLGFDNALVAIFNTVQIFNIQSVTRKWINFGVSVFTKFPYMDAHGKLCYPLDPLFTYENILRISSKRYQHIHR